MNSINLNSTEGTVFDLTVVDLTKCDQVIARMTTEYDQAMVNMTQFASWSSTATLCEALTMLDAKPKGELYPSEKTTLDILIDVLCARHPETANAIEEAFLAAAHEGDITGECVDVDIVRVLLAEIPEHLYPETIRDRPPAFTG
jgi:hypothetical protein